MYQEKQQFRQPWLWALLIGVLGISLYRQEFVAIGIVVAVLVLFAFLRLDTRINNEGIAYRWFPFQPRPRLIAWHQIEQVKVREYSPLGEFGGWGIRFGWKATAHTVSGNAGIEIRLKNKKRLVLIGTQQPEEVRRVIEQERQPVA
ncbi:hypothetical protein ACFPMF_11730 [Larkinella bovis]|uniref:PH domain-containing protein n=1 Tax=Larkinella bovis TaxID=683041 RepID=A0ABW0IC16_9BACT